MDDEKKAEIIGIYNENLTQCKYLIQQAEGLFKFNDALNEGKLPVIHSIKSRIKDPNHLIDKVERKINEGRMINKDNFFSEITDLVGVRVLYLYQDQFSLIHSEIIKQLNEIKEWRLHEPPRAYTWDPESKQYYESIGISTELKDSYYTSVHYIIKKNNNVGKICCEIQIRTLFEEIWGEIDHTINYPYKTESIACKEQLRVLSKLVSTGTRLSDSIFRSFKEFNDM